MHSVNILTVKLIRCGRKHRRFRNIHANFIWWFQYYTRTIITGAQLRSSMMICQYITAEHAVLCNGDIYGYNTCTGFYGSAGKHLYNDVTKKSGKAHIMPIISVTTPLHCCSGADPGEGHRGQTTPFQNHVREAKK